jgi:hypothetical protein
MKDREPKDFVEIWYLYKGERYVRTEKRDEALDRIESITMAGAIITKIESFKA